MGAMRHGRGAAQPARRARAPAAPPPAEDATGPQSSEGGPLQNLGSSARPFNQTTIDHILLDQRSTMIALGRTAGAISRRGWTRRTWDLRRSLRRGLMPAL